MTDIEFSLDPRENAEKRVYYKQYIMDCYLSQYSKGKKKEEFWTKAKKFGLKLGSKFAEKIPFVGGAVGAVLDTASESIEGKKFTDENIDKIAKQHGLMTMKEFDEKAIEAMKSNSISKNEYKKIAKDVEENREDLLLFKLEKEIDNTKITVKKLEEKHEEMTKLLKEMMKRNNEMEKRLNNLEGRLINQEEVNQEEVNQEGNRLNSFSGVEGSEVTKVEYKAIKGANQDLTNQQTKANRSMNM